MKAKVVLSAVRWMVCLVLVSVVACGADDAAPDDAGVAGTSGAGGTSGTGGSGGSGGTAGSGGADECNGTTLCNDDIDCTADSCSDGCCVYRLYSNVCTGAQVCDLREGGCTAGTPCGEEADCVDSDPCTKNERCDLSAAACKWDMLDNDDDGHVPQTCGGDDFDDADASLHPCAPDRCDGKDNDADGTIDEAADAVASCNGAHTTGESTCTDGACVVSCVDGFGDCDADPYNGCEADLSSDDDHCGQCDFSVPDCVAGAPSPNACSIVDGQRLTNTFMSSGGAQTPLTRILSRCGNTCFDADNPACEADCISDRTNEGFNDSCELCMGAFSECTQQCPDCEDDWNDGCAACICLLPCAQTFRTCANTPFPECVF